MTVIICCSWLIGYLLMDWPLVWAWILPPSHERKARGPPWMWTVPSVFTSSDCQRMANQLVAFDIVFDSPQPPPGYNHARSTHNLFNTPKERRVNYTARLRLSRESTTSHELAVTRWHNTRVGFDLSAEFYVDQQCKHDGMVVFTGRLFFSWNKHDKPSHTHWTAFKSGRETRDFQQEESRDRF